MKLIVAVMIASGAALLLGVDPASAASRSHCYVVDRSSHFGASGEPIRRCGLSSARHHYTVGKTLGTGHFAGCAGKPRGYKFIRKVHGEPQLVTCGAG